MISRRKMMIFKYEKNKLREYRKIGLYKALIPSCVYAPVFLIFMYLGIKDIENSLLIIFLVFVVMIISCGAGLLMGYKIAKKEFESYQIEFDDKNIVITSNMQHKKINISKIVKILKDNKNNYYIILNKINKIKIFHYIENIEEFERYLNNIYSIEQYNERNSIFEYIPIIFYFALIFISRYGNIELYIIFAFLVLITVLYSVIKLLFSQFKFKHKIIGLIVYVWILYGVINGIYTVINYLKNKI
jgi:hypothetical protein